MKWLGIVLLIGAGSAIGFYRAYELKQRILDIMMLQNTFRMLETEIYYTLAPVPLAIAALDTKLSALMRTFFETLRDAMEQEHLPLSQAWEKAMHILETESFLSTEELTAVQMFGISLGEGDVSAQQKNFQLLQQRLQHALDEANHNRMQQARVWQYMGVCVSVSAALLLC